METLIKLLITFKEVNEQSIRWTAVSPSVFLWASSTLIARCRCIITGKLTVDQRRNISLKTPLKELLVTSWIPRLALKSIRSQWFTPAKDMPVALSCDFILQGYIGFSGRALLPHTSGAGLQEAVVGFHALSSTEWWCSQRCKPCPRGWSEFSWLCFNNTLPKHVM